MADTITIPAPIASVGERVEAMNYRRKFAPWELGTVIAVRYWFGPQSHWAYDVRLDRGYGVYVTDDRIRRIQPQPAQEPSR